jgi:hypothetical protein
MFLINFHSQAIYLVFKYMNETFISKMILWKFGIINVDQIHGFTNSLLTHPLNFPFKSSS